MRAITDYSIFELTPSYKERTGMLCWRKKDLTLHLNVLAPPSKLIILSSFSCFLLIVISISNFHHFSLLTSLYQQPITTTYIFWMPSYINVQMLLFPRHSI